MQNPGEDKFRRIKLSNAAFQSRVASLPSSITFFEIVGFQVRLLSDFALQASVCGMLSRAQVRFPASPTNG